MVGDQVVYAYAEGVVSLGGDADLLVVLEFGVLAFAMN